MKKALLITTAAMIFPAMSYAADAKDVQLDGFIDIVWTLSDGTDEGVNGDEGHFSTSGELDMKTTLNGPKGPISLRMDADLNPAGSGDSGRLEQAFLSWDIENNINLKAGVFNNNMSWEKEDAPDMYQVTHGLLWDIWNGTTDLDGNNITGLELAYTADIFTLSIGFLNDLDGVPEENSVKFAGEIRAMPNLVVNVGLVTQDAGLENIIDINATWKMDDRLTVGGEIMMPDEFIDNAIMIMANYVITKEFSATARYEIVSPDASGADDLTALTFAGLYTIDENLFANAEIRINSDDNVPTASSDPDFPVGEGDGNTIHLELLATF